MRKIRQSIYEHSVLYTACAHEDKYQHFDRESNCGRSLDGCSNLSRSSWLDAQGFGFNDVSRSHDIEISHVYNSINVSAESVRCWSIVCLSQLIRCPFYTQVKILRSNEYFLEPTFRRHTRTAYHGAYYLSDRRYQPLAVFKQACQNKPCYSSSQCCAPTLHDSNHR